MVVSKQIQDYSKHRGMLSHYFTVFSGQAVRAAPRAVLFAHTTTCPTSRKTTKKPGAIAARKPRAAAAAGLKSDKRVACAAASGGGKGATAAWPVRGPPGKVRLGFLPEEWFLFLHSKTGVTGPYVLGLVLTNYLVSKEIYVLEHEYYSGLSIAVMVIFIAVKFGPAIGAALDKQVDEFADAWENSRLQEINSYKKIITEAQDAQKRAEGQKLLMDAKKENVLMQLEAAYRERAMRVYAETRGRLEYQVRRRRAEARVQQKWLVAWVLEAVRSAVTPDLQQQALTSAVAELEAVASHGTAGATA